MILRNSMQLVLGLVLGLSIGCGQSSGPPDVDDRLNRARPGKGDTSATCNGRCGHIWGASCACDWLCVLVGDCCDDVADFCSESVAPEATPICAPTPAPPADFCTGRSPTLVTDEDGCFKEYECPTGCPPAPEGYCPHGMVQTHLSYGCPTFSCECDPQEGVLLECESGSTAEPIADQQGCVYDRACVPTP
jgi:hypothetical protein